MTDRIVDNAARHRFELEVDGLVCFANYRRTEGQLAITHVEAPPPLRGTGAARRLMEGVLAIARTEGVKVQPLCGYAADYIRRHPEHQDLLG
jgi:predicted GNAT family acetyltransferase